MSGLPLLLASTNRGKITEFESLLSSVLKCASPLSKEFATVAIPNVVEDGATYYENALKKALAFQKIFRVPVLSDDSGLEVDVLGGRPGVHSARYGGEKISWTERWNHLYGELQGHNIGERTARFRCVLCYFDGKKVPQFFEGVAEGRITDRPQGSQGFGYDPLFFSPVLNKTFGQATKEEKDLVSHRSEAVRRFIAWWKLDRPVP